MTSVITCGAIAIGIGNSLHIIIDGTYWLENTLISLVRDTVAEGKVARVVFPFSDTDVLSRPNVNLSHTMWLRKEEKTHS